MISWTLSIRPRKKRHLSFWTRTTLWYLLHDNRSLCLLYANWLLLAHRAAMRASNRYHSSLGGLLTERGIASTPQDCYRRKACFVGTLVLIRAAHRLLGSCLGEVAQSLAQTEMAYTSRGMTLMKRLLRRLAYRSRGLYPQNIRHRRSRKVSISLQSSQRLLPVRLLQRIALVNLEEGSRAKSMEQVLEGSLVRVRTTMLVRSLGGQDLRVWSILALLLELLVLVIY